MANLFVSQQADNKYGGQKITQVDQATLNAQVAEVITLAHSHANKALLDTYSFSNADVLDAIAKKHEPVTVAAGNPFGLTGQELSFLYDDAYLQVVGGELGVKVGDLLLGTNTTGFSKTGPGKMAGGDLTLNLPQRIDTAATVRYENESIGGAYDPLYKLKVYGNGNVTGNWTVDGNVIIGGNLTVAGDSVTFEVGTLVVEDKNIEIAKIATPTDTFANGGGLILKGSTDHTWLWDSTYQNWTSSEHVNIASGKSYKVNNNVVIDADRYGYLQKLNINGPADTSNALNLNGNGKIWGDLFSDNFNSVDPYLGYYIGRNGSIFSKITATEMHVKNFITDLEFGFAGGMIIVKSVAELAADFTVGGNLQLKEYEGYSGRLMQDNDFVRLRNQTRGETSMSVTDIWGQVVYVSRNSTTKIQTYTFTKIAGFGTGASKGTLALDYGTAGNGGLELVAINEAGKLPYLQTFSFATNPWTDMSVNGRFGELTGLTTELWGALTGKNGLYTETAYLVKDIYIGDTAVIGGVGVGMLNGMTALFHFDDNLYDSFNRVKPVYSGTYAETSYGLITATGLIATKAPGKFGGAIAVETATTNSETVYDFSSTWTQANFTKTAQSDGYYRFTCTDNTNANRAIYKDAYTMNTGNNTFSIDIKNNAEPVVLTVLQKTGTTTNTSTTIPANSNGRFSVMSNCTVAGTCYVFIYINNKSAGSNGKFFDIRRPQWELNKAYSTSFAQGSRSSGVLKYSASVLPPQFSINFNAFIDFSKFGNWTDLIDIAQDDNNSLRLERNNTNNYFTLYFYKAGSLIGSNTGSVVANGWHKFSISWDGASYKVYVDGSSYAAIASTERMTVSDTTYIWLGSRNNSTAVVNAVFDELAIFNRALTAKEELKINHSNQPFNESAGLTVITGNQIKTGIIQSENYVIGTSGSMWNLNTGYLETADGWFRGTITASAGAIGGWTIDSHQINNSATGVNGYAIVLDTITTIASVDYTRPRLAVTWGDGTNVAGWGGNFITLGAASYLHTANGAFTTTGWNVDDTSGGLSVNINGKNVLFAGKRGSVVGAAIASFMFDDKELNLNKKIGGTDYKIIRMGDFTAAPVDISTDVTANIFTAGEAKFNSSTAYNAWTVDGIGAPWNSLIGYDSSIKIEGAGSLGMGSYTGSSISGPSGFWYIRKSITAYAGKSLVLSWKTYWKNTYSGKTPGIGMRVLIVDNSGAPIGNIGYLLNKLNYAPSLGAWHAYNENILIPSEAAGYYLQLEIYMWSNGLLTSPTWNGFNVDDITLKEYTNTQCFINAEGLTIYNSPVNYFKFTTGGWDLATTTIKVNNLPVAACDPVIFPAAQGQPNNLRHGGFYVDSNSKVYLYHSTAGLIPLN